MILRINKLWLFVIIFILTSLYSLTHARSAIIDANVFYFTSDVTASADSSSAVTAFAFFAGFSIDKKGQLLIGWNYASYATTDEATNTIEYSSSQMGPGIVWFMNKNKNWRLGFAYNLETTAEYDDGVNVAEDWRGTGMAADLGYDFYMTESLKLGLRLNYSSSSYSEVVIGSAKSDESYSKNMIFPSVAFSIEI